MRLLVFIWGLSNIISCGHSSSNLNNESSYNEETVNSMVTIKVDTAGLKLSRGVEKIIIEYWDNYYANNFMFKILSDDEETTVTYKGETLFTEEKKLTELEICNRLINYVNKFYIDKTEEIVLGKNENDPLETDHPGITVQGFKEGKKILDGKEVILYSHLDYNPKFIEFYKLLKELIRESE